MPRWATPRTPNRKTLGAGAAWIAEALGTPLLPWQQQVLDVALELDPATGKLAYREIGLTVPRQSGKTTLLLVLILTRALQWPRQNIRYTAQTGSDARKKWMDDWLPILQPSPFSKSFHPRLTNGHEALIFKNGSHQGLVATTKKTGHGGTLDLCILDEAFAHPDARLEQALKPAMVTRPQPQFWVVSTAGTFAESPYLWGKVENGRQLAEAGARTGVAYFEWSAPEDADPSDPDTWRACMPALGHTVTEDVIRADYDSMPSISEFRRAYLNQWVALSSDPVIPLEQWHQLTDAKSVPQNPVIFAFDVTPDRAWAAIAVAGKRSDGIAHIEIVDHRAGTGWVADRLAELVAEHKPAGVYCDPTGPAGALLADLDTLKVEVTTINASQHAQACGQLYDAVVQGQLRHLGTPELIAAIDGASQRPLGDAWAWSRKASSVDIAPLVAVTIALWGHNTAPPPRRPRVVSLAAALAGESHGL